MRRILLLVFFFIFSSGFGQSNLWNKTSEENTRLVVKSERTSMPKKFELYSLDFLMLKNKLQNAPLDSQNSLSNLIISFPNPNGELEDFRIYEAPIMEKGLAEKYPDLKSYSGRSIKNHLLSIRFSTTLFGLHLMSLNDEKGTYFIDTYTKDLNNYIVYRKKDISPVDTFQCHVVTEESSKVINLIDNSLQNRASDSFFRTYRLAMACTIEYAAFHVTAAGLNGGTLAQKKAAVLSAMVVTMTRVNGVFENDMALRMNLVATNDLVIFIDSDSFDNANSSTLINQSQTVIDANIGSANYDIGHTVSTGGGGLAQLQSPCGASKARGITGQGSPVGDPFDIDYVAHEMGHQWGGNHTQNNACNRNTTTAVEPGSASTIMGYAGICAPNVQSNSDPYFHTISISEMITFISGTGGTCAVAIANGNAAPTANAGADLTIPKGTAFILKGSGSDSGGDVLTYCWEQTNNQASTQPPAQTSTTGPSFRSISPSTSPNRYMPPLASVVAGVLNPTWEVVPTVARTMNFALTVRDNRLVNGGQTKRDDMILTVANVGPFLVTSPNTVVSYAGNSNQTFTWDAAGTTANGINCANVDIYLSTNGGVSFPILLQLGTPNDGTQAINIPNLPGTTNRIMIAGSNHIFYDVSNTNFTITAGTAETTPPSPPTLTASGNTSTSTVLSWSGAFDNVAVTSYDVYQGAVLIGNTSATTYTVTGLVAATSYTFTVRAKDADGNVSIPSNAVMITTNAPDTTPPSPPTLTASGTTSSATNLSWSGATDNIAVTGYNVYQDGLLIGSTTLATTYNVIGLSPSSTFAFTVRAKDAAGNLSINSNTINITTDAPDTTPPLPPILSASVTTSTSTNLSWSGATDNVAVTGYDVYRGASLIGTVSTTSFGVTGLVPFTTYSFTVRAKDAAGNISIASNVVTITTTEFTYCTSQGSSVVDELIGTVQIGNINNVSTGGSGYSDFTNLSTNLTLGSNQTITIIPTWIGTAYPEGYAVFIDYNRDGDFVDAGETVFTRAASTTTPIVGTFVVPNTATLGSTRMRVSLKYNGIPTACETFSYGQVEDYTVNIVPVNTIITVKLFIEGFYNTTSHQMFPVKANQGVGVSTTNVDDVTLELRDASTLALAATTTSILQTNGLAAATFNSAISGSYYLVIKHRNALQTWSSSPITVSSSTPLYDFSTSSLQAYGANMTAIEPNVYAIYSGDLDNDGFIDLPDYSFWETDYINSSVGSFSTDLDGDSFVDLPDYSIWEQNYNGAVNAIFPVLP
jgi:chitodextrinase